MATNYGTDGPFTCGMCSLSLADDGLIILPQYLISIVNLGLVRRDGPGRYHWLAYSFPSRCLFLLLLLLLLLLASPPQHTHSLSLSLSLDACQVLVGGSTSTWTMDVPFASRLVRDTCASIDAAAIPSSVTSSVQVGGVLFLTSRRTPPDIVTFLDHRLKQEGDGNGAGTNGGCGPVPFFLWDPRLHGGASLNASHSNASTTVGGAVDAHGAPQASTASVVKDGCWRGNNPYIPSLASASVIIVTPDSVSLASEACSSVGGRVFVANAASTEATCKCDRGTSGQSSGLTIVEGPVRGWEARIGSGTGHLKPKLRRFHRLLWSRGYTSPMTVAGVAGALQEAGKAETMEAGEKQECSRTDGGGSVGGCGDTERGRREGGNWQCLDDTGVAADLIRSHPLFRSILETWHSPLSLPPPPPTSPPPPPPLKMAFDLQ